MLPLPPSSTLFPYTTLFRSLCNTFRDPSYAKLTSAKSTVPLISGSETVRRGRSEEHTSELQSLRHLVCRLLLEKKKPAQDHGYFDLQEGNEALVRAPLSTKG